MATWLPKIALVSSCLQPLKRLLSKNKVKRERKKRERYENKERKRKSKGTEKYEESSEERGK